MLRNGPSTRGLGQIVIFSEYHDPFDGRIEDTDLTSLANRYIHLTKIHRQSDEKFITMLQNIRLGHTTDADLNVLLQHREVRNGIALFSLRGKARDYNNQELNKLRSHPEHFSALDHPKDLGDKDEKHRFDKQLTLKAGMPVVLLANVSSPLSPPAALSHTLPQGYLD
ncbi:uncharacterized protein BDZ83DRAFT_256841 [Colletotrichum acutatum]|uniref:Uncharacterized protein n=1 Tax=Glomerella acutata TaxID=27357 RepID=A0AAD8XGS2_GLOAC|nr:uncharacterized protein BDZ83DRAFT_256841 [Colletotrichum acutatum]KAK1726657.1 hypothetical protein BDZ83DRAFT_256841 [Colletotrichum acutatum]